MMNVLSENTGVFDTSWLALVVLSRRALGRMRLRLSEDQSLLARRRASWIKVNDNEALIAGSRCGRCCTVLL